MSLRHQYMSGTRGLGTLSSADGVLEMSLGAWDETGWWSVAV